MPGLTHMAKRTRPEPRKLLIASVGVATISYVGMFGCSDTSSRGDSSAGNLMGPYVGAGGEQDGTGGIIGGSGGNIQGTGNATSGNLMSPCYPNACAPGAGGAGGEGQGGQGGTVK